MKYFLDSVVIIDVLNGVAPAKAFIKAHAKDCALGAVTIAEALVGTEDDDRDAVIAFLSQFKFLPMDPEDAILAASLRRKYRWKLPDTFQAALSLKHGLKLATRNTKDFDPTKLDFVHVPYRWS